MEPKVVRKGECEEITLFKDQLFIHLTGRETGGRFSLVEHVSHPGSAIPLHVHDREDEVFHIIGGTVVFQVGDRSLTEGSGSTVYIPKRVSHSLNVAGDVPARILVSILPAGLEEMFRELSRLPSGPPDMTKVSQICGRFGVTFL